MAQSKKKPRKTAQKASSSAGYFWGVLRITIGFYFLWAFLDKLLGLGFSTCRDAVAGTISLGCERAWLFGGSPTTGYLNSLDGTFAATFQGLAGNTFIDWLFMLGLLGIGLALMLGIGMRVAVVTGSLLLFMMYVAALPLTTNPLIDDHIIYILALFGLLAVNGEQKLGFGAVWARQGIVKKYPILV